MSKLTRFLAKLGLVLAVLAGTMAGGFAAVNPEAVTPEEVRTTLSPLPPHPRLFAARGGLARLAALRETPDGRAFADRIIYDAGVILNYEPVQYELHNRQLLRVSRNALYRLNTLGMAYLLTRDVRFARRGIREMAAIAAFPSWNPHHFLDVGEMTLAMAVGYDWFFDQLTPEERRSFAAAIREKGLLTSLNAEPRQLWWIAGTNNWTQVCHAGIVAGALALYEDDPELSSRLITRAVQNLPRIMRISYAPEGAYPEGPTYWSYGTEFNAALLGMLDAACGTDFGLSALPGFDRTGEFIVALQAPSGLSYNYADSTASRDFGLARIWWIHRFQRNDCFSVWMRRNFQRFCAARWKNLARGSNRMMPLAMFYLHSDWPTQGTSALPLGYFSGNAAAVPLAVHRSDATDQAYYLGIKGGKAQMSHGHMDAGSFLIEAGGVRWTAELGQDDYSKFELAKVGIWDMRQGSGRWKIFRYSPRSHNILMIDDREQAVEGLVKFREFRGEKEGQTSVLDLTPAYRGQLREALRTGRLLPEGGIAISDRLTGLTPGAKMRWQLCLPVEIAAVEDGRMLLEKDGVQLEVRARGDQPVHWQVVPAARLEGKLDAANPGIRLAWFEWTAPADGTLACEVNFKLLQTKANHREREKK